jgi:hypothetical protein
MYNQTTGRTIKGARWVVLPAIVAAVAAAGIAHAAIPSSNGTISACLDAKGALKVIDAEAGTTCAAGREPLTWNQQGPQGAPGVPGPKGDPGLQGAPGVSGYELVADTSAFTSVHAKELVLECPSGKKPLGGGGYAALYDGTPPPVSH